MIVVYGKERRRRFPMWLLLLLICVSLLALLAAGTVGYMYWKNEYRVELSLLGDSEIVLEYGQDYTEQGAEAVGFGTVLQREPTECQVTIRGHVDTQRLGTYTLHYQAEFEGVSARVSRKVTIVDREAPSILLRNDLEYYTIPGQSYEEEGFIASDNYDGDLTAKVTSFEKDGQVFYSVTDTAGNETKAVRDIYYKDPIAPELTLKGDAQITITAGDDWTEIGYTATDNVDGDLTGKVIVTGKVDTGKPGTYHLIYQVSDSYENTARTERVITVKAKSDLKPPVDPDEKTIYLTFDDGPGPHTTRLLEVLKKYNVKATFFVCNTAYVDLLDDIAADGHTVAIHTYSHNYSRIYASEEAFYKDLNAMQDLICSHTGVNPVITRFPGGSSNSVSRKYCVGIMTQLTQSLQEKGFYYFDWNVDSGDAGGTKTTEGVVQNVINGISRSSRKNHYVLQHDIYGFSVDAVEEIIVWGLENGYTFKAITPDSPTCHHGVKN